MQPDEIAKLESYLRSKFKMPSIALRKRPQKDDSVEVFMGEEFIGLLYRDEEDGELSYSFQMAILDYDLEDMDDTDH